jgi:hypothetical protein
MARLPRRDAAIKPQVTRDRWLLKAMAIADIVGTSGIQWNAHSTSVLQTQRKSVTKLEAKGIRLRHS